MKLLSSIKRWIVAKDSEISESIERGNEIQFARQDLEKMKSDMALIISNVGSIKSTIIKLKREVSELASEKEQHEKDATALIKNGREELAMSHAARIEAIEEKINTLEASINQQENLLKTQISQKEKFSTSIKEAENSIKMMESMDAVARSTEKISAVKIHGTSSALARFKERQKRIQERLDKAQAVQETLEESSSDRLQTETSKALGKKKGADVLARLKEKIA